jgi:DNA-directed RNA polymerase subunit RPC12/RpoP
MQGENAAMLRREWDDKLCTHPDIDKEYYKSMHTGEYVCTTCGEDFRTKDEWQEARSKAITKQKEIL